MKLFSKLVLLSLGILIIMGCDKKDASVEKAKTITKPIISSDSRFSLFSENCQLIGVINIQEIAKMESVKKMIEDEDQTIPYYKEIKASGFGLENLKSLYFAAEIPPNPQEAAQTEGVFILEAISKINLPDFIALVEKNNDIIFKREKIGVKEAFILSDELTASAPSYIIQLNDTMLAVGTKSQVEYTVSLLEKGGKSVLGNEELMKASNNTQNQDMVWFAAAVPPEINRSNDPNSPDINDLFLAANYKDEALSLQGKIVCSSEQDVQKIIMPAQILISMAVMSSNNTIKQEDLSLNASKNELIINFRVSKEALSYMLEESAKQIQQPVVSETEISEEIVPSDDDSPVFDDTEDME